MAANAELQRNSDISKITKNESQEVSARSIHCYCCIFSVEITRANLLKRMLLVILVLLMLTVAIALIVSFFNREKELKIVTREEWQGLPSKEILTNLSLPVSRVIIHSTNTNECFTMESCSELMRKIQMLHMHGVAYIFSQIAYNFVVTNDGSIFEGRGWDLQGAHTSGYNSGSIGVAYSGVFMQKVPTQSQLDAGHALFKEGVRLGKLTSDYKIYAASQLRSTLSPGNALFEIIKTWSHFSENVN